MIGLLGTVVLETTLCDDHLIVARMMDHSGARRVKSWRTGNHPMSKSSIGIQRAHCDVATRIDVQKDLGRQHAYALAVGVIKGKHLCRFGHIVRGYDVCTRDHDVRRTRNVCVKVKTRRSM